MSTLGADSNNMINRGGLYLLKVSLFLVIVTLLAEGCSEESSQPPLPPASAIVSVQTAVPLASPSTSTPPPTLLPTATPTPEQTPTQTYTATSLPKPMQYHCLDIASAPPTGAESSGVIAMFDFRGDSPAYLLDIKTGLKMVVAPESGGFLTDFVVSPDGIWLAYWLNNNREDPAESQLFISDANGQTHKTIPWEKDWRMIAGWLDGERLLINRMGIRQYDLDSLIILNPFSMQIEELTPTFPDINISDSISWNFSRFIIEPTLSRVVYAAYSKETNAVVLWDVYNKNPLVMVPVILSSSAEPKWSPDGGWALLEALTSEKASPSGAYDVELYSISFEGEVTRLTYLTDEYASVGIRDFSWSPDGRRIAFWVVAEPSQYSDQRLAVLDTMTGEVTNYCIPGSINGDAFTPIWSPNGQQIAIANQYDTNYNIRVILVDIVELWAARIAENMTPVGWMK